MKDNELNKIKQEIEFVSTKIDSCFKNKDTDGLEQYVFSLCQQVKSLPSQKAFYVSDSIKSLRNKISKLISQMQEEQSEIGERISKHGLVKRAFVAYSGSNTK